MRLGKGVEDYPLLRGPLFRGPLLKGPLLKGPLLKGPLLKGPLLKGPLLKGPLADDAAHSRTEHRRRLLPLPLVEAIRRHQTLVYP